MKDALLDFYTSSGKRKPDQIIIFRDGVSESQFNQGSPDNVLHGTVIDKKVCHPKNNDFYLGTNAGMIGITRQTHYHVLLDQAGFSTDDLQEDASKTSSSHGGMYVPGVIPVPQLSRLKDKVCNFILVC
ncbi:Protein argonaute 4 -like protein [Gossypium arboreum]|uniref:Protein argonaute 4-like protein n=1 Tax=Gossypium arboreum TaxID=29729 RepID=A0A0B0MG92_GOSAR|nr:Protein argonaute 4 -like protein [Gossypium arboreum]